MEIIKSLVEYISLIKKMTLRGCYFRGENSKFPSITSSLIRNYKPTNKKYGLVDIYKDLVDGYYQEVGNDITETQKTNFLAFCQHHGLHTNLIDFTTAPLVALYFACVSDNKESSEAGYVYVLKNTHVIDASELLNDYCAPSVKNYNIYSEYFNKNTSVIQGYKKLLWNSEYINHLFASLAKVVLSDTRFKMSNDFLHGMDEIIREKSAKGQIPDSSALAELIRNVLPNIGVSGNYVLLEYCTLLYLYFIDISTFWFSYSYNEISDIAFPETPYLIYKTPLRFDRIKNQFGVFIYQGFFDYETSEDEYGSISVQQIKPDLTIEITNKQDILRELDLVGINRAYIYGDFDNIAKYINEKYSS